MKHSPQSIRKLLICAIGFCVGIVIFSYAVVFLRFILLALLILGTAIFAYKAKKLWRQRAMIFICSAVVGLSYAWVYRAVFIEPILEKDGEIIQITAAVSDKRRENGRTNSVDIRVLSGFSHEFNAVIYDFDGNLPDVKPGEIIEGTFEFARADELFGELNNANLRTGTLMSAYPEGEISIVDEKYPLYFPRLITNEIEALVARVFPEDVVAFMTALLTGERSLFYENEAINIAMGRAGITHVVAVSGMHVSFIAGLFMVLGRKIRIFRIFVPIIVITFMIMTGMTSSVMRAGFMFLFVYSANFFEREHDTPTVLGGILLVMLIISPISIYVIGFQLSFGATAGIIMLTQPIYDYLRSFLKRGKKNVIVRGILASLSVSLAAIIPISPLIALHFGYVSTLTPLANLLIYPIIGLVFVGGYVCCILYLILPAIAVLLASILAYFVRYIYEVAFFVSSLPGSAVYIENSIYIQWLIFVAIIFAVSYLKDRKIGFRPIFPACLSIITLCFSLIITNATSEVEGGEISIFDVGQGQSILMLSGSDAVVIDSGSGGTFENSGEIVAQNLLARGINSVSALVLTHLHEDHANGAVTLMEYMPVQTLVLAKSASADDELYDKILETAEGNGTEIRLIVDDGIFTAGDIELNIIAPLGDSDENERGIIIHGGIGNFDALITGDVGTTTEDELTELYDVSDVELLVLGHHGSRFSTGLKLMEESRPDYAVVSSGYNSYGHPTAEAMERATTYGAELFRTDLQGCITFYIGENLDG